MSLLFQVYLLNVLESNSYWNFLSLFFSKLCNKQSYQNCQLSCSIHCFWNRLTLEGELKHFSFSWYRKSTSVTHCSSGLLERFHWDTHILYEDKVGPTKIPQFTSLLGGKSTYQKKYFFCKNLQVQSPQPQSKKFQKIIHITDFSRQFMNL